MLRLNVQNSCWMYLHALLHRYSHCWRLRRWKTLVQILMYQTSKSCKLHCAPYDKLLLLKSRSFLQLTHRHEWTAAYLRVADITNYWFNCRLSRCRHKYLSRLLFQAWVLNRHKLITFYRRKLTSNWSLKR